MKILYRQSHESTGSLAALGIGDCYYKQLQVERDRNSITRIHHHTGFELHILTRGRQQYQAEEQICQLEQGMLLLIPPKLPHRVISSEKNTEKISITFTMSPDPGVSCVIAQTPSAILDSLSFISQETSGKNAFRILIENRILEIILLALRLGGMTQPQITEATEENSILTLSRQYIADNIQQNPTVSEVAQYCYLSTKQLTRIYNTREGMSPGAYIIRQRGKEIERLLIQEDLSLQQISSQMHFSSEYYFNVFFKKYIGMPPGEYRRMHGK